MKFSKRGTMNSKFPLVSIIIPAFNASEHIKQCIVSIINQTYSNLQIIIIDDGSSDDTFCIAKEFANKDSRFVLLKQKNNGVSAARNKGLERADGEYTMFVDSDDFLPLNSVELRVHAAMRSGSDVVYSGYSMFNANKKTQFLPRNCFLKNRDIFLKDEAIRLLHRYCLGNAVWSFLIKKSIIEKYHLYFAKGISYGEDMLFLNYLFLSIDSLCILNADTYCYRLDSGVTSYSSLSHAVNDLQVIYFLDNKYRNTNFIESYKTYRYGIYVSAYLSLPSKNRSTAENNVAKEIKKKLISDFSFKKICNLPFRLSISSILIVSGIV